MIAVSKIVEHIRADLDAEEDNDYYRFDEDFKPALNKTIDWVVMNISPVIGNKDIYDDIFSELLKMRVFQTSAHSRVSFAPPALPLSTVWSVKGVHPLPKTTPEYTFVATLDEHQSVALPNLSYLESDYTAKRLTIDEYNVTKGNPYQNGNNYFENCDDLKSYAYIAFQDYSGAYPYVRELEIRPKLDKKPVAINYIKVPDYVALITDQIEFPQTMRGLIYSKALQYISYKQGDQTNIFTVSQNDLQQIMGALS